MKRFLALIVLMLNQDICSAQFTPVFQTAFYFEDAAGNKDTIVVGGDTIVTNEVFDPTVFRGDSIKELNPVKQFEVFTLPWYELLFRDIFTPAEFWYGFHPIGYNYYKNVVIDFESAHVGESVFFLFKCTHYPITVRWDTTFYAQYGDLISTTHFLPDNTKYSNPDIYPVENYPLNVFKCLQYDGKWTFHLGNDEDYNRPWEKVKGFFPGVQDSMFGILLNYFPYISCQEPSSVQPETGKTVVKCYPNPAQDEFMVQFPPVGLTETSVLHLYSSTGRLLRTQSVQAHQATISLSVKDLPMGLYFYDVSTIEGAITRGKLIKN